MEWIAVIFGEGKDLSVLQMGDRALVVFILTLVMIRISGRRSFGIRTPLDNIVVILLGAILSRAIVGVSPFIPVVIASFLLVTVHRLTAHVTRSSPILRRLIDGKEILLYKDGTFISEHLKKAVVCEKDIIEGIRKTALTDDLDKIDRIYMECTGEITVVKKELE